MFFDLLILNPQHKGNLGLAWIAGTQGVKRISADQMKKIDIIKLCNYLSEFIRSESSHSKKDFLYVFLQFYLMEPSKSSGKKLLLSNVKEIIRSIQIIHIPDSHRAVGLAEESEISPDTPKEKVKSKRKKKTVIVTPQYEEMLQEAPIGVAPARLEEMLDNLPRPSEAISLREEAPYEPIPEQPFQEQPLIVFTEADLRKRAKSSSSSSSTQDLLKRFGEKIVVVPQIHASKGSFLDEDVVVEQARRDIEQSLMAEPVATEEARRDITQPPVFEEQEAPVPVIVPPPPAAPTEVPMEVEEVAVASETVAPTIELIETVPAIAEEPPTPTKPEPTPKKRRVAAPKVAPVRITEALPKVFCKSLKKRVVHINRCLENANMFVDERYPLFLPISEIHNENVYNFLCSEIPEIREDQIRAGSTMRTISGSLLSTRSSQSTLRKTSTPVRTSKFQVPELPAAGFTFIEGEKSSLLAPAVEFQFPLRESREPEVEVPMADVQRVEFFEEVHATPPQPPTQELLPTTMVEEQITGAEQPSEKTLEMEIPPSIEVGAAVRREGLSPVTDSKIRQQKIVDKVMLWNYDEGPLMMADICQLPITKRNMAIAFSDVLVLCSKKYVRPITHENSLEIKSIGKGPKLLE